MTVKFGLRPSLFFVFLLALATSRLASQGAIQTGTLRGTVTDATGAVVPGAQVTALLGAQSFTAQSGHDGAYSLRNLVPGSYTVTVAARGFAELTVMDVTIAPGQIRVLELPLTIAVEHQQVTVTGENQGVSINSDQNASAMVIRGRDLDALSDDPDELQNELQALAGPAAGPNGGQIYIDGFSGGQIPPKSSILEIRVNQNPFSAEYDRIGYGRIEIITKPGTQKLHGSVSGFGTDSGLNAADPLLPYKPAYDLYSYSGTVNGPLTKNSTYYLYLFRIWRQADSVVDAVNPQNTSTKLQEAYPDTWGRTEGSARVDFQAGKRNTLTIRDFYWRSAQTGTGVGTLNLPAQASNNLSQENTVQIGDTLLINEAFANDIQVQWRRMRNSQSATDPNPTVTVQGSFTGGGNSSGTVQDHQDDIEIQDRSTATAGRHTLRFGADSLIYRDANYSNSGVNGTYMFSNLLAYQQATPTLYSATVVTNPAVHATVFTGSFYLQDDWKIDPNFVLGLGLRYEGQNWIADHNDWAPRIALAWSPWHTGTAPARTVVRAGYGWFYTRFSVPNSFSSFAGTPYVIETLHDNLINQQSYTVANPNTAFPSNQFNAAQPSAIPSSLLASAAASTPTYHTIDPHFHAALDMQMGIGIDRALMKGFTGNITYLYTQGVHQYMSNNVTAPEFDPATYKVIGAIPPRYNYQFQSEGIYKQSQIITNISGRLRQLTLTLNYTYDTANSDTQGVTSFVSDSQNPGLDYGRASFAVRHEGALIGSFSAPDAVTVAGAVFARSGVPYNITIGSDLTGNNQFNARPTYAASCNEAGAVTTQYGCLDETPAGTGERIVPYGVGLGPSNSIVYLRASKVIGIGPRMQTAGQSDHTMQPSSNVQGRGLSGGGTSIRLDAAAPRKYSLTLAASGINLFNHVNLAPPNGVLESPLFNQTQSLASGTYGNPIPGNRAILLQSNFSF